MKARAQKYLEIFDSQGNWRHHSGLLIIAVLTHPEKFLADSLYRLMVKEEDHNPAELMAPMSPVAQRAHDRKIRKRETLHILAGEVVLELARISNTSNVVPTLNSARRLVAYNQGRFKGNEPDAAQERNVEREVQKAFRKYRDISHIMAAFIYLVARDKELAGDERWLREILSIARRFEQIVDVASAAGKFEWDPLRIPEIIPAVSDLKFPILGRYEIGAANIKSVASSP